MRSDVNIEEKYLRADSSLVKFLATLKGISSRTSTKMTNQLNALMTPLLAIAQLICDKKDISENVLKKADQAIVKILKLLEEGGVNNTQAAEYEYLLTFAGRLRSEINKNGEMLIKNLSDEENLRLLHEVINKEFIEEKKKTSQSSYGSHYQTKKGELIFQDRDNSDSMLEYSFREFDNIARNLRTINLENLIKQLVGIKKLNSDEKFNFEESYERIEKLFTDISILMRNVQLSDNDSHVQIAKELLGFAEDFANAGMKLLKPTNMSEKEAQLAFINLYTACFIMDTLKSICPSAILPISRMFEGVLSDNAKAFSQLKFNYNMYLVSLLSSESCLQKQKYLQIGATCCNGMINELAFMFDPARRDDSEGKFIFSFIVDLAKVLIEKEEINNKEIAAGNYRPTGITVLTNMLANIHYIFINPNEIEEVDDAKNLLMRTLCEFANKIADSKVENCEMVAIQFLKEALDIVKAFKSTDEDDIREDEGSRIEISSKIMDIYLLLAERKKSVVNDPAKSIPYLKTALSYALDIKELDNIINITAQLLSAYEYTVKTNPKIVIDAALKVVKNTDIVKILNSHDHPDKERIYKLIAHFEHLQQEQQNNSTQISRVDPKQK